MKKNATVLFLNLTVTSGDTEAEMLIGPPGCAVNGGCEHRKATSDGEASWRMEDPAAGSWRVRVFKEGPGAAQVGWELTADQRIVSDPGNATDKA